VVADSGHLFTDVGIQTARDDKSVHWDPSGGSTLEAQVPVEAISYSAWLESGEQHHANGYRLGSQEDT
jgi:hypothetical protein